jgi:hypothetical protein
MGNYSSLIPTGMKYARLMERRFGSKVMGSELNETSMEESHYTTNMDTLSKLTSRVISRACERTA